jgi:hypothetical protein
MYGETLEWSIYHHLIIELHTSKKDEEGASESRERVEDEAGDGIPIRSQFQLLAPSHFHEINKPSNVN